MLILQPKGLGAADTARQRKTYLVVGETKENFLVKLPNVTGEVQMPKFAWEIASEHHADS